MNYILNVIVAMAPVKPTLSQVHSVKTGICQNDKCRERQLKEKIKIETQFIRKLMSIKQQINDFKQGFKKGEISKTFFFFVFCSSVCYGKVLQHGTIRCMSAVSQETVERSETDRRSSSLLLQTVPQSSEPFKG